MAITVGARELKNRLGTYLRLVREGAVVLVSERGRPVAELRGLGPGSGRLDERLRELAAMGILTLGDGGALEPVERAVTAGRPVAETLVDDRQDRQ
jgi:prevent-host-death family protein